MSFEEISSFSLFHNHFFSLFPQNPYLILNSPAYNTAPPHQPIKSHHSHYPFAPKVPQPNQSLSAVHLSLYKVILSHVSQNKKKRKRKRKLEKAITERTYLNTERSVFRSQKPKEGFALSF